MQLLSRQGRHTFSNKHFDEESTDASNVGDTTDHSDDETLGRQRPSQHVATFFIGGRGGKQLR